MLAFLFLAVAPIATMLSASDPCPPRLTKACALVESIATEMTQSLAERELAVGEFHIESFKASGPILRIVQRTTYTESEFKTAFSTSGRSPGEYVGVLREVTLEINCLEPTREIIETGGSIDIKVLFKDGGVLHVQTISACPPA